MLVAGVSPLSGKGPRVIVSANASDLPRSLHVHGGAMGHAAADRYWESSWDQWSGITAGNLRYKVGVKDGGGNLERGGVEKQGAKVKKEGLCCKEKAVLKGGDGSRQCGMGGEREAGREIRNMEPRWQQWRKQMGSMAGGSLRGSGSEVWTGDKVAGKVRERGEGNEERRFRSAVGRQSGFGIEEGGAWDVTRREAMEVGQGRREAGGGWVGMGCGERYARDPLPPVTALGGEGKGIRRGIEGCKMRERLVNTKMKEGAFVADHVNEFNSILSRLMSVDIKFDDEVQALLLLSSLPESWSDTVTTISGSTGSTKLKFDNIRDLILREDIRRKTSG
ncbi:hypothetical protein Tco_0619906 [Tanacetum coccineum]